MAEAHIKITSLNKRFGKLYAINDVNLEVERGEYIVILGPTGAGKTTLLKLIAGLVKPTSGMISKNGELLNQIPPEKRNMAYLPQTEDYSLFPYMSVWENTIFSPKVKGEKPWEEVVRLGDEILGKNVFDAKAKVKEDPKLIMKLREETIDLWEEIESKFKQT